MSAKNAYRQTMNEKYVLRIREYLEKLPDYCRTFLNGIDANCSKSSQLAYVRDLDLFFWYLQKTNPCFGKKGLKEISLDDLNALTPIDIEEFLSFLDFYERDGIKHTNSREGKARKLSTLNRFYGYFYKKKLITSNAPSGVDPPKIPKRAIIRLDEEEISQILMNIETGAKLSTRQLAWQVPNMIRDLAIVTTLLGTGMRVSELVGLDLQDVDFDNGAIRIIRKGGNEELVYFGDEVENVLTEYYEQRLQMEPTDEKDDALFLCQSNSRLGRISVRTVERMVKKYATTVTPKHITVHSLRRTYGTALYRETGDIRLVADKLGHTNINTTAAHYAAKNEEALKETVNTVKLRKNNH